MFPANDTASNSAFMLKQSIFKGTWGLKGPVVTLALLFPLVYVTGLGLTRWAPYLYPTGSGLVILFLVLFKKATWEQLGMHREYWKQNLILGGLVGGLIIVAVPLLDLLIEASGMGRTELFTGAEKRFSDGSGNNISFGVHLAIVTGITLAEQLFLTGYLLQALLRKTKPSLAIYLGGIIFTLVHFDLELGLFILGLTASGFYFMTGSLIAPLIFQIACHTAGWLLTHHYPRVFTLLGFLF
ncbi:MAG: CPBP family intramembrane metalloprotease [Nitrospinae bacterium]|nr:CPBP family intramembrane metalloprotease [Nitrospinota bacterium]